MLERAAGGGLFPADCHCFRCTDLSYLKNPLISFCIPSGYLKRLDFTPKKGDFYVPIS